jgi:RNA polymerase sigma factor (sigma-70 family)
MSARTGVDNAELVGRARTGDEQAWEDIVRHYQPLITTITRRHRLSPSDADDVRQLVWTRLLEHVHGLRDPRALAGWISTTAGRTCLEVIRQRKRSVSMDPTDSEAIDRAELDASWALGGAATAVDDDLLRAERRRAVRRGLAELTSTQQQLLLLLVAEPPVPYEQISRRMGMPVGSIGPTRARLLKRLGDSVAVRLLDDPTDDGVMAVA